MRNIVKSRLAGLFLVCSIAVTSCYDDSALVQRVTQLEYNLEALQLALNTELDALEAFMDENIFIEECVKNDDGSYKLVLSSGNTIIVYPDQSLESAVTYISMAGTKYWAYYDEDGKAQLIYDASGSRIPITTVPKVVLEDGVNYLVFGSERYPLSGNSVFSAYELHSDGDGNVTSATFTFGEDMTFTVPVGNGNGIRFVYQNMDQLVTIDEQFVSYGCTENVQMVLTGVVDYVWKEPKGWTVEEYEDDYGYSYLTITAPSKSEIEAGNAVEGGVLKVVSVLEGNGAGVSRLSLTANPFEKMSVAAGVVDVEICFGLQKYTYGVCAKSDFNEEEILSTSREIVASSVIPTGYGIAEKSIETSVSALYGADMTPGEEYVLWAMPAVYDEEQGFLFYEGAVQMKEFVHTTLVFELDRESITFRDATVKMELAGVSEYYGGVFEKPSQNEGSSLFGNILPYISSGEIDPVSSPMSYEGSVFDFAGADLTSEPNTTYIIWLIVPELGKTVYTEDDVRYFEFTTDNLASGSSIEVEVTSLVPGYVDAKATVKAENAKLIFYSFMKSTTAAGYSTEELKVKYLLENGDFIRGSEAEITTAAGTKFDPGTKMTLFAIAVDDNGAYGAVKVQDFTTKQITYNDDLAVTLGVSVNEPDNLVVDISSASEGVEYIYWCGKTSETFWTSSSGLGGNETKASKFIFLNSTDARLNTTSASDGKIVFDNLSLKTNYVIVAMARKQIDGEMSYSPAKVLRFTTKAMALGTIVTEDNEAWAAAKPEITWIEEGFVAPVGMMTGTMMYKFAPASGADLTYYVLSGTESYFTGGSGEFDLSVDDFIIAIVEMTDKERDASVVYQNEESWVYPQDYKFFSYIHGFAHHGSAVIFPDATSHDAICSCGGCVTGTTTVNKIPDLPWEQKAYYYSDCPLTFTSDAVGSEGVDKVYVTCRDAEGNFYEPFIFDAPYEYFEAATSN